VQFLVYGFAGSALLYLYDVKHMHVLRRGSIKVNS